MKTLILTLALVVLGTMGNQSQIFAQTNNKKVWPVKYSTPIQFPKNPAIKLTPEERAAKLAELKAKDNLEVDGNGYITKAHKVLANLMVIDFDPPKDKSEYAVTDI